MLRQLARGRHIGPSHIAQLNIQAFRVDDQRASRTHARVDWRQGSAVLTDLSSFGTWVRFAGGASPVQLRRESCLLHGIGELALSAPFADDSAPVLRFSISGGPSPKQ